MALGVPRKYPLRVQNVNVQLGLGMSTKTDTLHTVPGKLSSLVNARFDKLRRLSKRYAFTPLGVTNLASGVFCLAVDRDQLVAFAYGDGLYGYRADQNDWTSMQESWQEFYPCMTESKEVCGRFGASNIATYSVSYVPPAAIAEVDGHVATIVRSELASQSVVRMVVREKSTGKVIWDKIDLYSALSGVSNGNIAVSHDGANRIVFVSLMDTPTSEMRLWELDTNDASSQLDADTSLQTTVSLTYQIKDGSAIGICPDSSDNSVAICYVDNVDQYVTLYKRVTGGGDVNNKSTLPAALGPMAVYKPPDQSALYIAYVISGTTNIGVTKYSGASFSSVATWTLSVDSVWKIGMCRINSTTLAICAETVNDATYSPPTTPFQRTTYWNYISTTPAFTTAPAGYPATAGIGGIGLAGRPVNIRGTVFVPVSKWLDDDTESQWQLVQLRDMSSSPSSNQLQPVALLETVLAPPTSFAVAPPTAESADTDANTEALFLRPQLDKKVDSSLYFYMRDVRVTMDNELPVKTVTANGVTFCTGGFLARLRDQLVPAMPLCAPGITKAAVSTTGGSIDSTGGALTLQYRAVYEYRDPSGEVTYGPPGNIFEVTVASGAAANKVTLTFDPQISSRYIYNTCSLVVYRTEDAGEIFYRDVVAQEDTTSLESTQSEANLVDNPRLDLEILGVTPDVPPGAWDLAVFGSRLWVVPSLERQTLWPSKVLSQGRGPEFSLLWIVRATDGGDIYAIVDTDRYLVVFKEDRIQVTFGEGPADDGTGPAFQEPTTVVYGFGTTERDSVVRTPVGVFFKSAGGIRLLTNDLAVGRNQDGSYIGSEVDDEVNDSDVSGIAHAVCVPEENEVRFALKTILDTQMLVYNYEVGQWSKWQIKGLPTDGNGDPYYSKRGVLWQGAHSFATADGTQVWSQGSTYADGSTPTHYPLQLVTDQINLAGIAGHQRVRKATFAVTNQSACGMVAYASTDGRAQDSYTWTQAQIAALTRDELAMHIADQKGSKIQLQLEDSAPSSGPGESYYVSGLQLEVGVMPSQAVQYPAENKR